MPDNNRIAPPAKRIFKSDSLYKSEMTTEKNWSYLLIAKSASESQYDTLINLAREGVPLPHGTLCLAGEGLKFHGFKGRHWDSPEGNIYLSAHFAPGKHVENYGAGFMILAAVSVVDAISEIEELSGRVAIKWVNDIFVDNAKVCGVLAHTMAEADDVTNAVIGIGLNTETSPSTEPTIFVPKAAALNDLLPPGKKTTRAALFESLTRSIYKNYLTLIDNGYYELLNRYREYSNVIGQDVAIYDDTGAVSEQLLAEGRVSAIGDNLELFLDGLDEPLKRGRLAIKQPN